jgi:hypothetical protein
MFGEYLNIFCSQHIPKQYELHPFNKGEYARLKARKEDSPLLKGVWHMKLLAYPASRNRADLL